MSYSLISRILFLGLLMLSYSCHNSGIKPPPSSFGRYISGFTYGVISIKSHIEIELQDEYKGSEKIGAEIKAPLFRISPRVEGKTILKSPNKIVFIPNEQLKSDQSYSIQFALKDAIREVDEKHENLEYQIRTIAPAAKLVHDGIVVSNQSARQYQARIITSDFIDAKEVEKNVSVEGNLPITWKHSEDGMTHEFNIKNIALYDNEQKLDIDIDLKNVLNSSDELKIPVPPRGKFMVTNVSITPEEKNKIVIVFSDNVEKLGNEGLIGVNGNFNSQYSFSGNRVTIFPGEFRKSDAISVQVNPGFKNIKGQTLGYEYNKSLMSGSLLPNAEILGSGNIIVDNHGAFIPIRTSGLNQLRVEVFKIHQSNVLFFLQNNSLSETYDVKRFGNKCLSEVIPLNRKPGFKEGSTYDYKLDIAKLVKIEQGAIYQVRLSFDKSMTSFYNDQRNSKSKLTSFSMLAQFRSGSEENENEDNEENEYNYPDDYDYNKKDDPNEDSYYTYDRYSKKNFLVSNIGLIAKKGTGNKIFSICTDVLTAEPMTGATVEVYNYQFQNVGQNSTDGNGYAEIEAKDKPYFIVATHNGQKSYLKLEKYGAQPLDQFDIEGSSSQSGMKAFVYGERGVWRPGDKLYLTMILSNGYEPLPKDLPSQIELINPKGQVVDRQVNDRPLNGFYSFVVKTADDAPTGNYTARFKVGGLKIDRICKIETVKPNRLRIVSNAESDFIQNGQSVSYNTSWLNGASTSGLKATVDLNIYAANTEFKGYEKYSFTDRSKQFSSIEQTVFNGTTDPNGNFSFPFKIEADPSKVPGMIQAVMTTKVFESGGDFSIQYDTKKVSFYSSYAGQLIGNDQNNYYLSCDKDQPLHIVNLASNGAPISTNKVKVSIHKVEYHWWYNSYNSQQYFDEGDIKELFLEKEILVTNGKAKLNIRIPKQKWGTYRIKVTDLASQHSSTSFAYFESPYYDANSGSNSSKLIQMSKSKDKYKVGETAVISMVSYFEGKALLSIENSAHVIEAKCYDIKTGKNEIAFKVTEEMSPNVYAYISALQPHHKTDNNLPIRTYGVMPILVDNTESILKPIVTAPQKIEPESSLTFTVSETNNKPMTYTVAIVDEGLLGISSYKTPDPWHFFYSRDALGVLTWDNFDEIMNALTGVFQDVFSIGGDEESASALNKAKSNRYESVVKYIGPFSLKGGKNTHTIDIPNYIGNLKVMVVSGGDNYRFGASTADVQVSKPLMVLATLPRLLSINEEVELPVNVFVSDASIKDVSVKVTTDNKLSLLSNQTTSLHFSKPSDQIISYKLKTKDLLGVSKVHVQVQSGKYSSTHTINIPIRIPNPPIIDVQTIVLNPNETKSLAITPIGIPGTKSVTIESSSIPELNIKSRVEELIAYPHGCLEQTTSALFPQLYLADLMDLTEDDKKMILSNIQAGNEKYKSFQAGSGALSYWPNTGYIDDYATAYATHYMVEAKAKGYSVNEDILSKSLAQLKKSSDGFNPAAAEEYQKNYQAQRLLVLASAGKPNLGAMNRLKETKLETSTLIKLALAYAYHGKPAVAKQMMSSVPLEILPYVDDRYTYGSNYSDEAALLEYFLKIGDKVNAVKFFQKNVSSINSKKYLGTQSTAMLLKSIASYLSKYKPAPTNIGIEFLNKKYSMKGTKPVYTQKIDPVSGTIVLKNNSNTLTTVSIIRKGTDVNVKTQLNPLLTLDIKYIDKKGNAISPDKLARQTDFKQVITIKNNSSTNLSNLALTNYLPAGWEIINKRIASDLVSNSKIDYQDIRDNRVLSYFGLNSGESKIIMQDLNATYEGVYHLPAVILESMYIPDFKTVIGSSKTLVSKN